MLLGLTTITIQPRCRDPLAALDDPAHSAGTSKQHYHCVCGRAAR